MLVSQGRRFYEAPGIGYPPPIYFPYNSNLPRMGLNNLARDGGFPESLGGGVA